MGKNSQVKKTTLNMIMSVLGQVMTLALGILIPRLYIANYGSEMNGFQSTISQILVYVGLLEAGIGTAALQKLYKPVRNDDWVSINAIMSATNKSYKKVAIAYLLLVVALSGVYPFIIKTTFSHLFIFAYCILSCATGFLNFFVLGKYTILLQADGKSYIKSTTALITNISNSLLKILLLKLGVNILAVVSVYAVTDLVQIGVILIYIKKNYNSLNLKVKPSQDALNQKNDVLVHQISGLIFSNTDSITISVFCGLQSVSVYYVYNMIFNTVSTLNSNITSSCVFILGQTYGTQEKNFERVYEVYETLCMMLVGITSTLSYLFIIPFVKIYTHGITDISYLDYRLPLLFSAILFLTGMRISSGHIINIAGHFKETKKRAIAESCINIMASIICVNLFGLPGVLLGTIVALLYRSNDMVVYANKMILNRKVICVYKKIMINLMLFLACIQYADMLEKAINSVGEFFGFFLAVSLLVTFVFVVINFCFFKKDFLELLQYVKRFKTKGGES